MPPRNATPSVPLSALSTLHARMVAKADDYTRTASAYKGKCHHAKKVELLVNAKVASMLAGWLQETIDQATPAARVTPAVEPQPLHDHDPVQSDDGSEADQA